MKIRVVSVLVDDQDKALKFYTGVLGFVNKNDIPMGEHRWLTVVSGEEQDGVELLLEPMSFPSAKIYQKALFDAGVPFTVFNVNDIQKEFERLTKLGVVFSMDPTDVGTATLAVFDDTCGNNIQIAQV